MLHVKNILQKIFEKTPEEIVKQFPNEGRLHSQSWDGFQRKILINMQFTTSYPSGCAETECEFNNNALLSLNMVTWETSQITLVNILIVKFFRH